MAEGGGDGDITTVAEGALATTAESKKQEFQAMV